MDALFKIYNNRKETVIESLKPQYPKRDSYIDDLSEEDVKTFMKSISGSDAVKEFLFEKHPTYKDDYKEVYDARMAGSKVINKAAQLMDEKYQIAADRVDAATKENRLSILDEEIEKLQSFVPTLPELEDED